MDNNIELSVVILSFNTKTLLKQTIESVKSNLKFEIIVADNGSTDGSVEMVREKFPQVLVVENKKNIGFAAGNNRGLKKARGKYLMLLNSDTKVEKGSLDVLFNYLEFHPKVGGITPKLILSDGSLDAASHRGLPTLWNSFTYFSGLERMFVGNKFFGGYHQTWKDLDTTHQVDAVSMASLMFRRELLDDVGYLDEDFFMYAEDIDYCKRIKDAGWKLIYNPEAQVIHYKGKSGTNNKDKEIRSQTKKYFYSTMKQYFKKHYGEVYPGWVLLLVDKGIDVVASIRK